MLPTIIQIASKAGGLALAMRDHVSFGNKADGTWVTDADRATEELIKSELAARFPGQTVLGEETGASSFLTEDLWVIDPIDGTTNYVRGLNDWGVSIALVRAGRPELGVFHLPATGQTFAAQAGGGATLNGRPIHCDRREVLDANALIGMNSYAIEDYAPRLPSKPRNFGSMAAHGCYVASGGLAAAIFCRWHSWDIAAALCIAFEAGAVARFIGGGELTHLDRSSLTAEAEPLLLGPEWAAEAIFEELA